MGVSTSPKPSWMSGNKENGRVASPESVHITTHLP